MLVYKNVSSVKQHVPPDKLLLVQQLPLLPPGEGGLCPRHPPGQRQQQERGQHQAEAPVQLRVRRIARHEPGEGRVVAQHWIGAECLLLLTF